MVEYDINGDPVIYWCKYCDDFKTPNKYVLFKHVEEKHIPKKLMSKVEMAMDEINERPLDLAKRESCNVAYTVIDPLFLEYMAKIGGYGAAKYGWFNWHKSELKEDKDPINHALAHINSFQQGKSYDHLEIGSEEWIHLVAAAFNLMMKFWQVINLK